MEKKELEIACPCCGHRLTIDVRTETVLRKRPPARTDGAEPTAEQAGAKDWDTAFGRVRDRPSDSASKLDSALDRERNRERDLDDLFKQARDKAGEDE